jgi:hypothetical protein
MNTLDTYIAGLNIRINHRYGYIARICANYLKKDDSEQTDDDGSMPDISVEVTDEDMEGEKKYLPEDPESVRHPAYIEAMAIFRKIAEALPRFGRFLMHGSAISVDGEGYIFTAPSGTGKSTHVSLWRDLFGERAVMVNDDKPFIRVSDNGVFVCGSPWNGKHGLGANICVPLKAVCLLERGENNSISGITSREAFPTLLKQSYRPHDPEMLRTTLGLIDRVSEQAGMYRLYCNMEPEAAMVSYGGMNGGISGGMNE